MRAQETKRLVERQHDDDVGSTKKNENGLLISIIIFSGLSRHMRLKNAHFFSI